MSKLNPKQEAFCHEYLIDSNATAASIRAGYSKRTAKEIGYEHLTKPHIKAYIAKLQAKTQTKHILNATEIQEMLSAKAKEDLDTNGLKALEMLNKMQGSYTEKLDITANVESVQYYSPKKNKDK